MSAPAVGDKRTLLVVRMQDDLPSSLPVSIEVSNTSNYEARFVWQP